MSTREAELDAFDKYARAHRAHANALTGQDNARALVEETAVDVAECIIAMNQTIERNRG